MTFSWLVSPHLLLLSRPLLVSRFRDFNGLIVDCGDWLVGPKTSINYRQFFSHFFSTCVDVEIRSHLGTSSTTSFFDFSFIAPLELETYLNISLIIKRNNIKGPDRVHINERRHVRTKTLFHRCFGFFSLSQTPNQRPSIQARSAREEKCKIVIKSCGNVSCYK